MLAGLLLVYCVLLQWSGAFAVSADDTAQSGMDRHRPGPGQSEAGSIASPSAAPTDADSIELLVPVITQEELAFLRAQRPKYERLNAVRRIRRHGTPEEALQSAKFVVDAEPTFVPAIDLYVKVAGEAGRFEQARVAFATRVQRAPADWAGWYGLAKVMEAQRQWSEALEAAKHAVDLNCPDAACYAAAAAGWMGLEQSEQGLAYFDALATAAGDDPLRLGLSLLGRGQILLSDRTKLESLLETEQRAASLLRPGRGLEFALEIMAVPYAGLDRREESVESLRRALAIHRERGDLASEAGFEFQLGRACYFMRRPRLSVAHGERALQLYRDVGDPSAECVTLSNLGVSLSMLGEPRKAYDYYRQALSLLDSVRDPQLRGTILANVGGGYSYLDEPDAALECFERALPLLRGTPGEAFVLVNRGVVYKGLGRLRDALADYRMSLEQERARGDQASSGVLLNMGSIYLQLGETRRAREYFEQGLVAARESVDHRNEATALLSLAEASLQLDELPQSFGFARQSLELIHANDQREFEGSALRHLGDSYRRAGDTEAAIRSYEDALEFFKRRDGGRINDGVLTQLGELYLELGSPERASAYFDQAMSLPGWRGNPFSELPTQVSAATAHARLGEREKALVLVGEVLSRIRPLMSSLKEPDLEASYFSQTASAFALQVRLLSSELPGSPAPVMTPSLLAETFGIGEQARARSFHRRLQLAAVDLEREVSGPVLERLHEADFALNQARRFLTATPSPGESATLERWLEQQLAPLLKRQAESGSPASDEARRLQRALAAVKNETLEPGDRTALLRKLLEAREREYSGAERALRDASPAYRQLVEPQLASLEEVQSAVDDHTALFAYLLGDEESFGWVVTRRDVRLLHLPSEKEISRQVEALRSALRDPDRPVWDTVDHARALYQTLMAPTAGLLPSAARLVIIPDGSLGTLPFEALVSRPPHPGERVPAWLGLEHVVTYAPSATVWREARLHATPGRIAGPMLLVGDPIYFKDRCNLGNAVATVRGADTRAGLFDEDWTRLCHAGEEADAIKQARRWGPLARWKDRYLLQGQASEASLRAQDMSRYSILHFVTHARAWEDYPLRSAIILSQTPASVRGGTSTLQARDNADGYLELREIYRLRTGADLVVLSACETAQGRRRKGDGVESLAQGFLMAGAKQVVASHWEVADSSTARFMGLLYQEMKRAPVADALFRVRRAFILGTSGAVGGPEADRLALAYAKPYYWAPFVLIDGAMPGPTSRGASAGMTPTE